VVDKVQGGAPVNGDSRRAGDNLLLALCFTGTGPVQRFLAGPAEDGLFIVTEKFLALRDFWYPIVVRKNARFIEPM